MKKGLIYSLITAIFFVTLEPVSKLIASDVNAYAITFWRFIIGSFILLPIAFAKIKREKIYIGLKDFFVMSALGVLFICISMIALQVGVKKATSPSLIAIVFSSNSIFTILFATIILKEKINRNKVIALILGALGVLLCSDFSAITNLESIMYGAFAAIGFSLYTVLTQKFTKKFGGIIQTSIVFLLGSIILFIMLIILKVDISIPVSFDIIAILIYLGIFVTGIGYACYFKAIEKGGAIMGSLAFFVKPILTPFVTLVINGVMPDLRVFGAVICIVGASYFATFKNK